MGLFDFLFGKKKMSLEEADKINDKFIAKNPTPVNDENALMRQAAKSMSSRNFGDAIDSYTKLAELYPAKKGLYESQIGAAFFFLGNYTKALEYYVSALKNGADKNMMDDNIWEASEELFNTNKDKKVLENYLEIFPDGRYKKQANTLLQN